MVLMEMEIAEGEDYKTPVPQVARAEEERQWPHFDAVDLWFA